jgi:hypothetical protein
MSSLHRGILRTAALLVPRRERAEWLAEWSAEMWYARRKATAFCLGAFQDALWMRRNFPGSAARSAFGLQTPARCLLWMAAVAAITVFLACQLWLPRLVLFRASSRDAHSVATSSSDHLRQPAKRRPLAGDEFAAVSLAILIIALFLACGISRTPAGHYPANHASRTFRLRRWGFFGVKIALLLPIVLCGSLDVASVLAPGLQPHGLLIGLVVGFRWVIADQRRRCPVCLHMLSNPTRIGGASQVFLDWYGTEYICAQGHGMLYLPEIAASWCTPRWQHLDPTWSSLFSA